MNFKSFRLFRKTLFVPVIQLRYNKYIQRADGGNDMANTTKLALEASLKELLRTKPIDRITINDLTEHCGISRMTFYYHFKDIYDLIEWSCVEDATRALEGNKTYDTWQQGFLQIFETVKANKPFIMNVYRSVSREQVELYLYKMTYDLLINVVNEEAAGMDVSEEDRKFIANYYKYAFVGLVLDWINGDMKEDAQKIIGKLSLLMYGNVSRALEAYRADFRQNS